MPGGTYNPTGEQQQQQTSEQNNAEFEFNAIEGTGRYCEGLGAGW